MNTGDGNDQISFGTDFNGLTQRQRSQIVFSDYSSLPIKHLSHGGIVPVPEPQFYAGGGLLLAVIAYYERRRRKHKASGQRIANSTS